MPLSKPAKTAPALKPSKRSTATQLDTRIVRLGLRRVDVAWMTGVSLRQVQHWLAGKTPVPQYVDLLLLALEQKRITPHWLIRHVDRPLPYSEEENGGYDMDPTRPRKWKERADPIPDQPAK